MKEMSPVEQPVTLDEFEMVLRMSFSGEIIANAKGWTPENPSFSHCSATVQIVNDIFGGEIRGFWFKEEAKKWDGRVLGGHFLNVLPNGQRIDFTKEQFPEGFPYDKLIGRRKGRLVDRKEMFSGPGSAGQYARLKLAVSENFLNKFGRELKFPV